MHKFLILALVLCGCGVVEPKKYLQTDIYEKMMEKAPEKTFDQSIMEHVDGFLKICEQKQCGKPNTDHLRNVSYFTEDELAATESDTGGPVVGLCTFLYVHMKFDIQNFMMIQIDKDAENLGPYSFKTIIYHETVHCLFGYLSHSPDSGNIMNEFLQHESYLRDNLDSMVDEITEEIRAMNN